MIYYFSGTGNSRHVASELARRLGEECGIITSIEPSGEELRGESVGFVFPVYSWGVAPLMLRFISMLPESFWLELKRRQMPVWAVMTCGDEVALSPEMLARELGRHGVECESVWSVIMPNNYVLLPGFDVDPAELERRKIRESAARIKEIAEGIASGRHTVDVVRGGMAWLKTKLVYPLFRKWGVQPRKWHSTDMCVGCGICVARCPLKNVALDEKSRPVWGGNCCSCLACYHSCPRHAVAYGSITDKKGQYFFGDPKPSAGR